MPRRLRTTIATAAVLTITGCGTSSSDTGAAPPPTVPAATSSSPASQPTCANRTVVRDLIVWTRHKGDQANAQTLGDFNYGTCQPTLDSLRDTSPQGPGYNADATDPPRPKKAVEKIGGGC